MNKLQLLKLGLAAVLLAPFFVIADNREGAELEYAPVPEPPQLPDPVESGEALEPEITIIQRDDATITEYRVNGNLYKIKVDPVIGEPYYMIDLDGDGVMEPLSNLSEDVIVPQWVIFSW